MFFSREFPPFDIACNLQLFIGTFHSTCSLCKLVKGLTFRAASSPPCMPCCCISSWRSCSPSWPAPSPSCKQIRRRGTSRCTLGPADPHCRYLLGMIQCCRILKSFFLPCMLCLRWRLVETQFWSHSECHHHKSQSMFPNSMHSTHS